MNVQGDLHITVVVFEPGTVLLAAVLLAGGDDRTAQRSTVSDSIASRIAVCLRPRLLAMMILLDFHF